MIPAMTEPIEDAPRERRTLPVTLGGHEFIVKQLTDVQAMHLARHARLLTREDVSGEAKLEAADRMFSIIHSCVDPEQVPFLIGLEESGEVELRDLVIFAKAFQEEAPQPVVRRRGRPRKSA